jgi:hypothetical protein
MHLASLALLLANETLLILLGRGNAYLLEARIHEQVIYFFFSFHREHNFGGGSAGSQRLRWRSNTFSIKQHRL